MVGRIPEALRLLVKERARGYCEYCWADEAIIIAMHIDHIVPLARGGETVPANLCLACVNCNTAKSHHQTATDPTSGIIAPLYNPRLDLWTQHFEWLADMTLIGGLTTIGRATVGLLNFNAPIIRKARAIWLKAGWQPFS